jgi:hypothetical protein
MKTLGRYLPSLLAILSLSFVVGPSARAELITTGNATFVFDNNSPLFQGGFAPLAMNRFYGADVVTATAAEVTAGIGGDSITVPGSGLVSEDALLNGGSVVNPIGRSRQTTNLDVNFSNVLATWGIGEQVGVDAVLRTIVNPGFGGGTIVLGDFSLINNAGTLVLQNNFTFPADAFTIGSPVFTDLGGGFSVTGDLLVSTSLSFLTSGVVPVGTNAGTFSMVAVPEPASIALVAASAFVGLAFRWSRKRNDAHATCG